MNARRAVERLLEMSCDPDGGGDGLDGHLDDAAIELLTVLCASLALAASAAHGKSLHKGRARERALEYMAGICTVLEVWRSAEAQVIDGPGLADSSLGATLLD